MSEIQTMGRNIVLCSDGTGNAGGKKRSTNVWRIYNALDRHHSQVEQLSFYNDGVGTDDLKLFKIIGGAFGWGLSRNLIELYSFAALNYRKRDRLYLFGFSRGAFTVRALAGMILRCGLLKRDKYLAEPKPWKLVKKILRAYQRDGDEKVDELHSHFRDDFDTDIRIEFIGVWDTVDAVGVPIDELRKPLDWLSRKIFKRQLYGFRDREDLDKRVKYGYQALSIDDERQSFHPNNWNPRQGGQGEGEVEQVWFPGAHSNVGGGYPKDAMSYVTLDWMMGKASDCGLRFNPNARDDVQRAADVNAKLYDARAGLGAFYRFSPRDLGEKPKIHVSVYDRIARGTDRYAPIVIPRDTTYAITKTGPYSRQPAQPLPNPSEENVGRIRRLVGFRKRLYVLFATFSGLVVGAGVVGGLLAPAASAEPVWPAWVQGFFEFLVPGPLEVFVDLAGQHPLPAGAVALILVGLRRSSTALKWATRESAFRAWRTVLEPASGEPSTSREEAVTDG